MMPIISSTHADCTPKLCVLPVRSEVWVSNVQRQTAILFYVVCRSGTAAELKEYLVDSHGILVRDASNFEGLDERYFRVAAQSSAKNDMLIKAVEEWMR